SYIHVNQLTKALGAGGGGNTGGSGDDKPGGGGQEAPDPAA
ncbi:DNA-binding protein, partial [Parabacteroides distasonis]|nr:DNA-binding protein [Parabacteroides distasonis]